MPTEFWSEYIAHSTLWWAVVADIFIIWSSWQTLAIFWITWIVCVVHSHTYRWLHTSHLLNCKETLCRSICTSIAGNLISVCWDFVKTSYCVCCVSLVSVLPEDCTCQRQLGLAKRLLGRCRHRWREDSIKIDVKMWCGGCKCCLFGGRCYHICEALGYVKEQGISWLSEVLKTAVYCRVI
jgi:hypothetical protein